MTSNSIRVVGARVHNLKNITVEIPRDKFVVITGLSGSGKSSLAFDTIFAEGQRRYVESLSAYARQFIGQMDKPAVDSTEGLPPAVSIDQKSTSHNPRSTVGTVTEIYDYLRLLYARVGVPHCPVCGRKITAKSADFITDTILKTSKGKSVLLLAPIIEAKKGTYEKLFQELKQNGYTRIRLDGDIINLSGDDDEENTQGVIKKDIKDRILNKFKKHTIEVVVDRIRPSIEDRSRLFDSVQTALKTANGLVKILIPDDNNSETVYSQRKACTRCGISIQDLEPRSFSFNSPFGACEQCNGLGIKVEFGPELVIPDRKKSILDGAIKPWAGHFATFRSSMLRDVGKNFGFDLYQPISTMTKKQLNVILYGTDQNIHYKYESRTSDSTWEYRSSFEGVIPNLDRVYAQTESEAKRRDLEQFIRELPCELCKGMRLRPDSLAVKISGKSIMNVCDLSIDKCYEFFMSLSLSETDRYIAKNILKEIISRLEFLKNVGLNYLTLNRMTSTLSGGESQRIRLATQIGSNLTGVLYVLDEPTIGLHQRDNNRLIETLRKLRDLGNTLIIVEHDEEVIRSSDWVVDIGPGAGIHGGKIVAEGLLNDIIGNKNSITGGFLKGDEMVYHKNVQRDPKSWLTLHNSRENNLKKITVDFPLGCMTTVTGVSGSGKSTLVNEILFKALSNHFYSCKDRHGAHDKITGLQNLDKVIGIDQSPIGRTPRSNTATYVNAFGPIREIFSRTAKAKEMGYKPGRFSFNVVGGRCDSCEGAGVKRIEMQFLADVFVTCEECKGKRYNSETLQVTFKSKSIADILDMTVEEGLRFFSSIPSIEKKLSTLYDVGLGYRRLGQPATTLSGGEAQRIKLSSELARRDTGSTLYILDEPTTGLHFADVKKLLHVLDRLVNIGNTVILIEHNLDVIAASDWIIDLGPEGGDNGGNIVVTGTPEQVSNHLSSHTGKYLKSKLVVSQTIRKNKSGVRT